MHWLSIVVISNYAMQRTTTNVEMSCRLFACSIIQHELILHIFIYRAHRFVIDGKQAKGVLQAFPGARINESCSPTEATTSSKCILTILFIFSNPENVVTNQGAGERESISRWSHLRCGYSFH